MSPTQMPHTGAITPTGYGAATLTGAGAGTGLATRTRAALWAAACTRAGAGHCGAFENRAEAQPEATEKKGWVVAVMKWHRSVNHHLQHISQGTYGFGFHGYCGAMKNASNGPNTQINMRQITVKIVEASDAFNRHPISYVVEGWSMRSMLFKCTYKIVWIVIMIRCYTFNFDGDK